MAAKRSIFRVAVALDFTDGVSRDVLDGIVRYAQGRGWTLGDVRTAGQADGVIRDEATPVDVGTPVVVVSAALSDTADVRPGAAAVGRLAAEHFLERGFRQFACDGPPACRAAFAALVEAAGHSSPLDIAPKTFEAIAHPLAVFAGSDVAAAGVNNFLRPSAASQTPWVAVLGLGNDSAACELSDPPLSSIDVGPRRLGHLAAARLDARLRGCPVGAPVDAPPLDVVLRTSTDGSAIADADVVAAVRFIHAHASGPLRVEDMVKAAGLDRRTLERRFAKHLGRSPADVLRRARVEMAAVLLRTTTRSIGEIARSCGFQLPQHLAASFKLQRGQTPSDYRASVTGA